MNSPEGVGMLDLINWILELPACLYRRVPLAGDHRRGHDSDRSRAENDRSARAGERALKLKHGGFRSNRHRALDRVLRMISAQTLRVCREGKPLHTFPDHALVQPLEQLIGLAQIC